MSDTVEASGGMRGASSVSAAVLLWISRTLLGLLCAYPLLSAVRATGTLSGPDADRVLFRTDSLLLLELLRVGGPSLGAALKTALLLAVLSAVAELLPLSGALDLLCFAERPLGERCLSALGRLPTFFALSCLTLVTQAALLLGSSLLSAAAKAALSAADERLLSLTPVVLMSLGLLACAGAGGVLDVARAAVVERSLGAGLALRQALVCLREEPLGVLLGAYSSLAGAALSYLCASWLASRLDLASPSKTPLTLAFATHQLGVIAAIAWRVRWLRTALAVCRRTQTGLSLR